MSVCLTLSNEVSDDSWKQKIPLINGLGTEGIGSVFQYHIMMNFFADFLEVDFTFPGSENLSHHSYTSYSKEQYFQSIDKFFNFPNLKSDYDQVHMITNIDSNFFNTLNSYKKSKERILLNLYRCHLHIVNFCQENRNEIFTKDMIDRIKNNLVFDGVKYFNDEVNISLHIRTPNPNDVPSEIVSPLRELYSKERDFYRYKNLINFLKKNSGNKKTTLHIHSQGFTSDFNELIELRTDNFDIKTHLDDHPISDIYHMANADLFVMSNSSFSWVPSLLNSNQKIVRDNFTNGPFTHNSIKANYDFTEFYE